MKSINSNLTSDCVVRDLPPAPAKTPWFPSDAKPARVGVYEVDFESDADKWPEFHYWNGKRWWYGASTPDGTVREFLSAPRHEIRPSPKRWRGLASNPASNKGEHA